MILDLIFANFVEDLAKKGENSEFFNSNAERAKIVLSAILKYAEKKVDVYCTDMCSPDVSNSDEYCEATESFLRRGGGMRVLFSDYNPAVFGGTKIRKILAKYRGQVEIKFLENPADKIKKADGTLVNFTVADNKAFRFEDDIMEKTAKCNFRSEAEAEVLTDLFSETFNDKGVPLDLAA